MTQVQLMRKQYLARLPADLASEFDRWSGDQSTQDILVALISEAIKGPVPATQPRPAPIDRTRRVGTRLSKDAHDRFTAMANHRGLTPSGLLAQLIDRAIAAGPTTYRPANPGYGRSIVVSTRISGDAYDRLIQSHGYHGATASSIVRGLILASMSPGGRNVA